MHVDNVNYDFGKSLRQKLDLLVVSFWYIRMLSFTQSSRMSCGFEYSVGNMVTPLVFRMLILLLCTFVLLVRLSFFEFNSHFIVM